MTFDPRILAGPAMLVIGGLLLWLAWRLWMVHPLNRVFRLGPFVTERGMRAVLGMRLSFAAFGLFLVVYGAAGMVFWFGQRQVNDPVVAFLGSLGAGLGLWAASLALIAAVRLWRVK